MIHFIHDTISRPDQESHLVLSGVFSDVNTIKKYRDSSDNSHQLIVNILASRLASRAEAINIPLLAILSSKDLGRRIGIQYLSCHLDTEIACTGTGTGTDTASAGAGSH